jgi:hypothetical protein
VQNAPAAVAQGQKQEAGAAQERPATASLEVNTGAALRAPVTVTQKETRKQRARRAKREKRGEVSPNIGVETTAQDDIVDALVLKNEADRLAGAHEGSELARAAEAAMEEAAAQVEATAQAESHPSMGVENTAQVEAQVLALAGCASHSNTGRGGLPQFGG